MADIRPFPCIRPNGNLAQRIAALPYDVYNRQEAKEEVKKEPLSFLKIDRAETMLPEEVNTYDPRVYQKARERLQDMITDGCFITDQSNCYYIYELVMDQRAQTGIVACASIDDYLQSVIKKHENTREEKEQDRIHHVDICNAQTGPIFLAYRSQQQIDEIVEEIKKDHPIYSFVAKDGIGHRVWRVAETDHVGNIQDTFRKIQEIYIADGHHRAASAVKVGLKRRKDNPNYTGEEEFNFFLSVLFPHDQLKILSYHRAVKDLNGLTKEEFLQKVERFFTIIQKGEESYQPGKKGEFGMYLDNTWYAMTMKEQYMEQKDPVKALDVSLLQNYLLDPILGIKDPRTDERIDFIGGIRGLGELEKRVSEDMTVAFSLYPTSIKELFDVSDADKLMPPKSTWFEPKLRSGLFIHSIS